MFGWNYPFTTENELARVALREHDRGVGTVLRDAQCDELGKQTNSPAPVVTTPCWIDSMVGSGWASRCDGALDDGTPSRVASARRVVALPSGWPLSSSRGDSKFDPSA